jgi:protein-S-isoprenylcysteine O-methyltransferase Ste14
MQTILLAYVLIGCFLALEGRLRKGSEAKSLNTGPFDRESTRLLGAAFVTTLLVLLLAPVLNYFYIGRLVYGASISRIGIVIMLFGIAARFWANRTLGEFYTRTLLTTKDQHLVEQGPYGIIRHPGYLGCIGMWVGAGLATANWIAAIIITLSMVAAYSYRIQCEEEMLLTAFGKQYKEYMARTWRLVPFIY